VFGATWDDTLGSLPPETRGKMTRRMRHLARRHDALLELPLDFPQDPEQVDRDVDDFIELHQQRRTTTGQPGAFADAEFAAFVRDAARAQARCGRLVLAFLRIDGERKAAICGFRHRSDFDYYLGGMGDAGDAMRYSPGIALHLWCMEAMFTSAASSLRPGRSPRPAPPSRPDQAPVQTLQVKVLNRLARELVLLRREPSPDSGARPGVGVHLTRRFPGPGMMVSGNSGAQGGNGRSASATSSRRTHG
jgi:hypothetical protein